MRPTSDMMHDKARENWGIMTILLHWLTAIAAVGLFILGLWMVDFDYYDPWYREGPQVHKSLGVLLFAATLLRLGWRGFFSTPPTPLESHTPLERSLAKAIHVLLYLLLISVMLSGYLISTADGRPIQVFDWFEVPATISGIEQQEDIAGKIHLILAIALITTAALHTLAALKHHFIDKDCTLKRMFGL